jgi:hypothetical protein
VLPPDAVVAADGAIVLPKDSAVTIDPDLTVASSGGEDLERATVNASGYTVFTPAPAALTGQAARVIRVRDGSGGEALISALVATTSSCRSARLGARRQRAAIARARLAARLRRRAASRASSSARLIAPFSSGE